MLPSAAVDRAMAHRIDDRVGLPVAIELVPEQVRGDDHGRSDLGEDLLKCRFVYFEDGVARAGMTMSDPAAQV